MGVFSRSTIWRLWAVLALVHCSSALAAWETGMVPEGNSMGARRLLAPAPAPNPLVTTGTVTIVIQNSTQAAADFLGALQKASEKVTVSASNSAGLFAQCTCESDLSGLQAQLLVALGAAGTSSAQSNGNSGGTSGQISISQLPNGQLAAATSSSASATAVGQNGAAIELGVDSATSAVGNSSTVGGAGTDTRGDATASDKEKQSSSASTETVQSGGSSRIAQLNNVNVTSSYLPGDALSTPLRTVVVLSSVSISYAASGLVTADSVTVSVHTESSATSRIDLIFPDPQTPGRVYVASIVGAASSACDCTATSTFTNKGDPSSVPLAQRSGSDARTESSRFATDPLGCNIYGSRPNPCFARDGSNSICCPGACPSNPGDVATCADGIIPPTGATQPGATSGPQQLPTSTASTSPAATYYNPPVEGACSDPSAPNPCYNSAGNAHTCCAGACGSPPGEAPYCSGAAQNQGTAGPTGGNPGTTSPTAGPTEATGTSSPTAGPSAIVEGSCSNPSAPNPCYNAAGNAHTCCAGACGSPPGEAPYCAAGAAAITTQSPPPTPGTEPPSPTPTGTAGGTDSSAPPPTQAPTTPGPTPTGCPGQGSSGAAACGQISQNSSSTGDGCTRVVATLNAQASGQTVTLYANQLADQLDAAFAAFCERPTAAQLAVSAGMVAERLAIATAAALLDATTTVCTCGDTSSFSVASIGGYVSAVATAIADTTAQAFSAIFGSGNCENAALLAQSVGFAQSTATQTVTATNAYYNLLISAQASDPVTPGGQSKALACQSSAVGANNRLVQLYAEAYACAIVTVFSSAYNDADPYVFGGQTTTDATGTCANEIAVAFSDPIYGPSESCSTSCQCQFGLSFAPNPADGGQTQTCQCPNGKSFSPEVPGCQ